MKAVTEFFKYIGIVLLYLFVNMIGVFVALIVCLFKEAYLLDGELTSEYLLEQLDVLKTSQSYVPMALCTSAFVFILAAIIIYRGQGPFANWNFNLGTVKYLFYGMGFNFILSIASSFILTQEYIEETNNSSSMLFEGNPLFIVATTAFFVPVFEELLFRHLFLNVKFPHAIRAIKENVEFEELLDDEACFIIAAIIQGAIFGLMHGEPFQMCYTFILGTLFAFIDRREQSLFPSICMHCGLNLYSALAVCFPESAIVVVLCGMAGVALILFNLIKNRRL